MGGSDRSGRSAEKELRAFYDAYADDLREHRREAIGERYDRRGVWFLGNGGKRHVSFEDNKKSYATKWRGPRKFDWNDLSFEIIDANSAVAIGKFEWQGERDEKPLTCSYTGLLHRTNGAWRIRVEDESCPSK